MASPHVPVARALRLPRTFAHVPGYLARHDPDLRIRRSAERPHLFVIERRLRRQAPAHLGRHDLSDYHVQRRDGYVHVATTNAAWLQRPWHIVRALREQGADLWASSAAKLESELEYERAFLEETTRRRRREEYRDAAREMADLLDRVGGRGGTDRTRISNPGLPGRRSRSRRSPVALH